MSCLLATCKKQFIDYSIAFHSRNWFAPDSKYSLQQCGWSFGYIVSDAKTNVEENGWGDVHHVMKVSICNKYKKSTEKNHLSGSYNSTVYSNAIYAVL